jgi:hypothetical protein
MIKRLTGFLAVLILSLSAFAQSTSFSTPAFSVTFNGPVTTSGPTRNAANTSTYYQYKSYQNGVWEGVEVRTIDHDIDVSFASSQFYRANETGTLAPEVNNDKYYQGHPFSYGFFSDLKGKDGDTATYERCERIIIVNSRTVIFIWMDTETGGMRNANNTAFQPWVDFEDSLDIK